MEIENRKGRHLWGFICLIMGIGGIVGHYLLNYLFLGPLLQAETDAARECAVSVPIFLPMFADIGFIGGLFFIITAIGFNQKATWAYTCAVIGNVISLKSSF